ncbi:MAG: hypothetical protein ACH254_21575, partial [Candidatus Thiodiazotropha endolucinida]
MATLSKCLRMAKSRINDQYIQRIRDLVREHKGDGMSPAEANIQAVDDVIEEAINAHNALVDQVAAKGVKVEKLEMPGKDKARNLLKTRQLENTWSAVNPDNQASKEQIDEAASEAATSPKNDLPEPTDAQKEAGNYKVGKTKLHGLDVSIENPKGSEHSGTDSAGKTWSITMAHHYGYIRGTVGKDKDHIDIFLGPDAENADLPVFVIDQIDPKTKAFDEHKVLMGFKNQLAAKRGYLNNYEKGWKGAGAVNKMSLDEFKAWLASGKTKQP